MTTVVLVGSLDTKGDEYAYAKERIEELGARALLVDTSTRGDPTVTADVPADEIARAGGGDLDAVRSADLATAQEVMIRGGSAVVGRLLGEGRLDAVFALGGSNNTSTAAAIFRSLPLGVPKLILTTMAVGDVGSLVGGSDLVLAASVADIAGLNPVTRAVIANAAAAITGMGKYGRRAVDPPRKPLIACSMIGLTSRAVSAARRRLEKLGYDVVVFHMTGAGGAAMEELIGSGPVAGVLDLTTSELADDLFGGVCSAGPGRLRGAVARGVPQVVGPGGLDMINFRQPDTVPTRFQERQVHAYNRAVTLVRTTPSENARLGRTLVERLVDPAARHTPVVLLPSGGVSALDEPGQPFEDPRADDALREAIRAGAGDALRVVELDGDLDRPEFGEAAAEMLHELINTRPRKEES
ncbi:MAG TPA: Tm-1-like ATP-binding domain-containing protein [Acidimicrobiales bacterium]|nr:Tm-1-like ATP-binding domain-containing protein [Acidimicrobiales bacterium]